jgi:uncharacterized membrane protein
MLPDPLHPAVVHFPIALSALIPLFAALILLAIRAGRMPARAWAVVVLMQALLVVSAWVAHDTGHDQEERVEKVVKESLIEEHEEAADWVFWLAVAGLAPAGLGLAAGSAGVWGRAGALAIALFTLAAAVRTGYLGGELVYRHGAANAYVEKSTLAAPGAAPEP